MRRLLPYLLVALTLALVACRSEYVNRTVDTISEQIKSLEPAKDNVEKMTRDEIEKLWAKEYKVAEFPLSQSSEELELNLSELGKDRWDCFHVIAREESIQFLCKRHPKSYLRYIPRVF